MPAPWTFGGQSGPIPLSELDDNFTYYSKLIHLTVDGTGTITTPAYATQLQVQLNNFSWFTKWTSGLAGDLYGFSADITRSASGGTIVGGFFSTRAASGVASEIWGVVTQAWCVPGATSTIVSGEHGTINETNNNTSAKIGLYVVFKDRPDGQAGTTQALGANEFNAETKAIGIYSQQRSTTGEKCGWRRGLFFDEFALDADYHGAAIGIDFAYVHFYGGTDPLTAYRMTAAIRMAAYQSILWNGDPTLPNDPTEPVNPIRTYFASASAPNGRQVLTNTGAEIHAIDVVTAGEYFKGHLRPSCRVNKAGVDQGGLGSGAFTKITFAAADFDNDSNFDLANDWFLAPITGTYRFAATVNVTGAAVPFRMTCLVYKNGSPYQDGHGNDSVGRSVPVSGVSTSEVRLAAGDKLEVYVYQDAGVALTASGLALDTSFSCSLITATA